MPIEIFLRETALTRADAAIRDLALSASATGREDILAVLHEIMDQIRGHMRFDVNATDTGTRPAQRRSPR
jgi:hypothetical protein